MLACLFLVVAASMVHSAELGFNYGNVFDNGTVKLELDYEREFFIAKHLANQSFTSARLYTMIQGDSDDVIEAIPAAISTQTTLLLGLWASSGDQHFTSEVQRLVDAVHRYGTVFTDLVKGISVGSEDIYRTTPLGIASNAGPGVSNETIIEYLGQVRAAINGTALAAVPIGHVDTANVWADNSTVYNLVTSCDFLGVDAYPFYETQKSNNINSSSTLFWGDYDSVVAIAKEKPVWVTETGWPTQGSNSSLAQASLSNAALYFANTGCSLIKANINTWWFTLQDAPFGVVDDRGIPLYNLNC